MAQLAFVTPTFTPDLERCELLVESLDRYAPEIRHLLIVDNREFDRFRHLESGRTTIVRSEELLGIPQLRVSYPQSLWLNWRTLPMRGWMRQQLLKIAAPDAIDAEALVYLDSDVTFVRPFSEEMIRYGSRWGLLDVDYSGDMLERWTAVACSLLGIDPHQVPRRWHVGHLIVWHRDHILQMRERIEAVTGRPWQIAIGRKATVSEYMLYAIFVRCVLGYSSSWHFPSDRALVRQPWSHRLTSTEGLRNYVQDPDPENVAVMVHSKFDIPVGDLRPLFEQAWQGSRR